MLLIYFPFLCILVFPQTFSLNNKVIRFLRKIFWFCHLFWISVNCSSFWILCVAYFPTLLCIDELALCILVFSGIVLLLSCPSLVHQLLRPIWDSSKLSFWKLLTQSRTVDFQGKKGISMENTRTSVVHNVPIEEELAQIL